MTYAMTAITRMPSPVTFAIVWYSCQVGFLAITSTRLEELMNEKIFSKTMKTPIVSAVIKRNNKGEKKKKPSINQ